MQHVFGESTPSSTEEPAMDSERQRVKKMQLQRRNSASPNSKMSSRRTNKLAPLLIPNNMNDSPERDAFPRRVLNRLSEQSSSSDSPPEVPPKSARMLPETSPQSALDSSLPSAVPTITPLTSFTPLLDSSESTAPFMPLKTRTGTSAPSPQSNYGSSPPPKRSNSPHKSDPSPRQHTRGFSESSSVVSISKLDHRRTESASSIMDRGRPKKRSGGSAIKSAVTKSDEQKAFLILPDRKSVV